MKNYIIVLFVAALVACTPNTKKTAADNGKNTKGIYFEKDSTLKDVLKKAEKADKLIFMDCYTSWCGPCKYLSGKIFTQKSVGDFYNKNFINVKFDMEKGDGVNIAKKYGVRAFPTLLFLNSKGEVVHKSVGAGDEKMIINLGKSALDPENNFKAVKAKIDAGDYSVAVINKFLECEPYYNDIDGLFSKYLDKCGDDKKVSLDTWNIIKDNVRSNQGLMFSFLKDNYTKFQKIASKKEVDEKIFSIYVRKFFRAKDKDKLVSEIKEINAKLASKIDDYVAYYLPFRKLYRDKKNKELWGKFTSNAKKYIDKYSVEAEELNSVAWFIFENHKNFNDTKALEFAKGVSAKSLKIKPESHHMIDTYANILFALGNKDEAIKYGKKALDLAKKDKADTKPYEQALKKFQGNM